MKYPTRDAKPHMDAGHKVRRNDKHDAYWCEECGEWIERKCSDPECEFCKDRPEKP